MKLNRYRKFYKFGRFWHVMRWGGQWGLGVRVSHYDGFRVMVGPWEVWTI